MRLHIVFKAAFTQVVRDRIGLALTLMTTPIFVIAYWVLFGDAVSNYKIAYFEQSDMAVYETLDKAFDGVFEKTKSIKFDLIKVKSKNEIDTLIASGEFEAGLIIPKEFISNSRGKTDPKEITLVSNASSEVYPVIRGIVDKTLSGYILSINGQKPPLKTNEKHIGISGKMRPFDAYVPGLLVFAVVMLIFSSSMTISREIESGRLARLTLTPINPATLLFGYGAVQMILGLLAIGLAFLIARMLGFQSSGSFSLTVLVVFLSALSSFGIGTFVASLSLTTTRAFLISSVSMFLLVLFSGIVFPSPSIPLFEIGNKTVDLLHFLPTVQMGTAMEKVLVLGSGIQGVAYELLFLFGIAVANLSLGAFWFTWKHFKSRRVTAKML